MSVCHGVSLRRVRCATWPLKDKLVFCVIQPAATAQHRKHSDASSHAASCHPLPQQSTCGHTRPVNTHACRRICRKTSPPSKRSTAQASAPRSPPLLRAAQPPRAPPPSIPPPPPKCARLPVPAHRQSPLTGPLPPPRRGCQLGPPPAASRPRSSRPGLLPPRPRLPQLPRARHPQEAVHRVRLQPPHPRLAACLAPAHPCQLAPRLEAFKAEPRRAQRPLPLPVACSAAPRHQPGRPRREGAAATRTAHARARRRQPSTEHVSLSYGRRPACCTYSPERCPATAPLHPGAHVLKPLHRSLLRASGLQPPGAARLGSSQSHDQGHAVPGAPHGAPARLPRSVRPISAGHSVPLLCRHSIRRRD